MTPKTTISLPFSPEDVRSGRASASPLDRIDVEGLKAAAERAADEPWSADYCWTAFPLSVAGDAFVTKATPATILELIAQRAALVEAAQELATWFQNSGSSINARWNRVPGEARGKIVYGILRALSTIQATGGGE